MVKKKKEKRKKVTLHHGFKIKELTIRKIFSNSTSILIGY